MRRSAGSNVNSRSSCKISASFSMAVSLFEALSRVKCPTCPTFRYKGQTASKLQMIITYAFHRNLRTINEMQHRLCEFDSGVAGREMTERDKRGSEGKRTALFISFDPVSRHCQIWIQVIGGPYVGRERYISNGILYNVIRTGMVIIDERLTLSSALSTTK
jgi:hypothetical protein